MKHLICLSLPALLLCTSPIASAEREPSIPDTTPESYLCIATEQAPLVDGVLDDPIWSQVPWTDEFIDICGVEVNTVRYSTRAAMTWDDSCFYVAAQLEEPHLWATYDKRDMVIYHENDFELFIDPDGDTHHYYELEINALNTVWDLLLLKPYRDGGGAVDHWDIGGLRTAVSLEGTLNDPTDIDTGWTVEIAIPWDALSEASDAAAPPHPGDQWRINFSRVQWRIEPAESGGYNKQIDPKTGQPYPEDNWVWSPQGEIAMHMPERWGIVQFAPSGTDPSAPVAPQTDAAAHLLLWQLYAREQEFRKQTGRYAELDELSSSGPKPDSDDTLKPSLVLYPGGFVASVELEGSILTIREDGLIRRVKR